MWRAQKAWQPDEDTTIIRLIDRMTYGEIAAVIPGRNRDMVAGRVQRLRRMGKLKCPGTLSPPSRNARFPAPTR